MKPTPPPTATLQGANSDQLTERGAIVPATAEHIERAANLLRAGDLVAFPTETVYGLGADATNPDAVASIYAAKGRPRHNPLIVHVATVGDVYHLVDLRSRPDIERLLEKMSAFWPGPLSLVMPRASEFPGAVSAGLSSIAVRIPRHPVALALLTAFGRPIAAPSANRSAYVSPTTPTHVSESLGNKVALILDGGACSVGIESTIVSLLDEEPRLLRPGGVPAEALAALLPSLLVRDHKTQEQRALVAPGMLREHYAPRTAIVFRNELPVSRFPKRVGLITFSDPSAQPLEFDYQPVIVLSREGNLEAVAAGLFAALRELDQGQVELIVVDTCPEVGLGRAIMDRLTRATVRTRDHLKVIIGKGTE